jgi:hypothetical protein
METYLKNLTVKEKYDIITGDKYHKLIKETDILNLNKTLLLLEAKTDPSKIIARYDSLKTVEKIYLTYATDEIINIINQINITDNLLNDFLEVYNKKSIDTNLFNCLLNKNCDITTKQLDKLIEFGMTTQSFYKKLIDNNFKFTNEQYNTLFLSNNQYIFDLAQTKNVNILMQIWLYILCNTESNIEQMKTILNKNNLKLYNIFGKIYDLIRIIAENRNTYDIQFEPENKIKIYKLLNDLLDKLILLNYNFKENFISNLGTIHNIFSRAYYNRPISDWSKKITSFTDTIYDQYILKFIQTYKQFGSTINFINFIDILKIEENPLKKRYHGILSTNLLYHIIFENKLLDFQLDINNLTKLFDIVIKYKYSLEDFTDSLLKSYNIQPSKELFELACIYGNTTLYNHVKSLQNLEYSKTNFKYACMKSNQVIIANFLDNKYVTDEEDIINICIGKGDKVPIFDLIIKCNVHITPAIYETIKLSGIQSQELDKNINETNIPIINKTRLDNMCNYSVLQTIKKKYDNIEENEFTGDGMIHLRNLYLVGTLEQIMAFENKYDIKPDVLCFENAIVNKDDFVMDYVLSEYKYIPSIVAIIRIKETEKRFTLMKKFYPQLCKIDYETNVCTKFIVLNNKKNDNPLINDEKLDIIAPSDNTQMYTKKTVTKKTIKGKTKPQLIDISDESDIVDNPINQLVNNPINQQVVNNPINQQVIDNPINQLVVDNPINQLVDNPINQPDENAKKKIVNKKGKVLTESELAKKDTEKEFRKKQKELTIRFNKSMEKSMEEFEKFKNMI